MEKENHRQIEKLPCEVFMEIAKKEILQRRKREVELLEENDLLKKNLHENKTRVGNLLLEVGRLKQKVNTYSLSTKETSVYLELLNQYNVLNGKYKQLLEEKNKLIYELSKSNGRRTED